MSPSSGRPSTRRAGRWCVGIEKTLKVIAADADLGEVPPYTGFCGRRRDRRKQKAGATSASVLDWARRRAREFRGQTWRRGEPGEIVIAVRGLAGMRHANKLSAGKRAKGPLLAVGGMARGRSGPDQVFFQQLTGGPPALRQLVRTAKGRWWVEHSYKELKEELGLDHFEGRSWRGWQHHVTLVMLAYAFLVLRRGVPRRGKKRAAS